MARGARLCGVGWPATAAAVPLGPLHLRQLQSPCRPNRQGDCRMRVELTQLQIHWRVAGWSDAV